LSLRYVSPAVHIVVCKAITDPATTPESWVGCRYLMSCTLRRIVEVVPVWVSEEILSTSEHIGDNRAVLWMSEN